jgi:hypothetical protein
VSILWGEAQVAFLVISPTQTAKADNVYKLNAPQFLAQAQPNSTDSFIGDKLDAEAGISAYYKAPDAILLSQVRSVFRTIEIETADYIIGSVAVTNSPDHFDVHVYVNKNGWILAYYLRADNVSKIVDVYNQTINTTKFTNVISIVASAAGAPFTEATYYDFRYPSATNMIFVAEDPNNGSVFTINMPSAYLYFERGWAYRYNCCTYSFQLDGVALPYTFRSDTQYGSITSGQLLPEVTHTIDVQGAYGVLVVTYSVP